ncbi:hypothetical protein [Streptomyces sp. NPDC087300]|uniref:hypothetical protein n=1 Tax=Streptomyces sp. NPDC087300 TaxID=3365780 RepID=UPI0037FF39FA
MRALPVRRIATTTLCATLLLGTAGPAFAATGDASHDETQSAPRAPAPAPDALLAQTKQLADVGGVLTPVTALLDAVLKADGNKLSADEAKKHADAVKAAIDAAAKKAPATPATPEAPAAKPPATPALPKLPTGGSQSDRRAPLDVKGDALAALQSAVDAFVKAATAGDAKTVLTQAPVVLTSLVNVAVATLLSGGLPAPSLPGLPALPKLPTGALPQAPGLPTGALPQTPSLPVAP